MDKRKAVKVTSSTNVGYREHKKRKNGMGFGGFIARVNGNGKGAKTYDCVELGYDVARTLAEHNAAEDSRRRREKAKIESDKRVQERRKLPRPLTGTCDATWAAVEQAESRANLPKLIVPLDGACDVVSWPLVCTDDVLFVFVFSIAESTMRCGIEARYELAESKRRF